ncbi:DUF3349 domain-containing protein [Nocardioides sp. CER19]|uniref:DUF3349 domain-containing protein n=1 Tax=Nocardioides sp. CER19 TaxID=3038538 RepID=UPI0024486AF1|nr:DUF3349 domain-containing protein [Nocardioides sp. CER19]MDH2414084.1 DUF3349 domain-containing protein [Nocardioides sp. CER19]
MPTRVARILDWLKAGYPEGIAPTDYPPVLGVLHRVLTDADIEAVADELALQSVSNGVQPITADDVRAMVREHAFQRCTPEELQRVSAQLAAGGWPLDDSLD